jgi:hypothetical protein
MAYELLVARRGHHVPFVTFGHWQWGDIDRGLDVFKDYRRREKPPPRGSSDGADHPLPVAPLVVLGAVLSVLLVFGSQACFEECREEQSQLEMTRDRTS